MSIIDLRRRKFQLAIFSIMLIFLLGVSGYMIIEGWSLTDSVYMTVITLTTVGYGEVRPLSPAGRLFTTILICFGVVAIASIITVGSRVVLEGQLEKILGRRKLEKEIKKLKNHYIICGYGRMGRIICDELKNKRKSFIVIENDTEIYERMDEKILSINGDATQDSILLKAGIKKAKGLVSVVSSDADNVYITLTARGLAPGISIVSRAGEEGSERKLLRAGADKVVSPYVIGGSRIAHAILRPAVVDFIELVTQSEHLDLQMEEVDISKSSSICNLSLPDSGIRQKLNIIVVAIKKESGHMDFNPSSGSIIEAGDRLIVLGGQKSLRRLEAIASGKTKKAASHKDKGKSP